MPQCAIKSCKNNARKSNFTAGVSYFRFPENPFTCQQWISIVARANEDHFYKPAKTSIVCSVHFDKADVSGNTKRRRLVKTAVPKLQIQPPPPKDLQIAKPKTEPSEVLPPSSSFEFINIQNENATHNQDQVDHHSDITSIDASVSDLIPVLETPKERFLKKKLLRARKIIDNKSKKIQAAQKRNKRLIKKNSLLKNIIDLMKKRLFNGPVSYKNIYQLLRR